MNKAPKIKVKFYLSGKNVDLNEISTKLDIQPSKSRTPDDWPEAVKKPTVEIPEWLRPCYIWQLNTEYLRCMAVSIQLEKLMELLSEKTCTINDLREKFSLKITIEVVIIMEGDNRPEMVLTKEIVEFAASIQAEIGFDLYID